MSDRLTKLSEEIAYIRTALRRNCDRLEVAYRIKLHADLAILKQMRIDELNARFERARYRNAN